MAGADFVMPGRYLQAEPLAQLIATRASPPSPARCPTIWTDLLRYAEDHDVDFSSLRLVMCGGSAVPRALMEAFQDATSACASSRRWGMTETSPLAALSRPAAGVDAGTTEEMDWRALTGRGRRRRRAAHRRRRRHGAAVGRRGGRRDPGAAARGSPARYYGDPTPEKFHDGWLRTGDVASVTPNGYIQITDRAKDVIKSGGEWISSVELEGHLMAHPDVVEAAVIARARPTAGTSARSRASCCATGVDA